MQLGFGSKFTDTITMIGRGFGCLILAMVSAWKFSIVFLGAMPIISACMALLVVMVKKYTVKEFESYGSAGKVAQEVLSSIRTVYAFGLQKKKVQLYDENLKIAEAMSIKKGNVFGFFGGLAGFLFNAIFGIGIYYAIYLIRTDCETYQPGSIMQSFFSMITASFALGQALPFLKDLTEGKIHNLFELKSIIIKFF